MSCGFRSDVCAVDVKTRPLFPAATLRIVVSQVAAAETVGVVVKVERIWDVPCIGRPNIVVAIIVPRPAGRSDVIIIDGSNERAVELVACHGHAAAAGNADHRERLASAHYVVVRDGDVRAALCDIADLHIAFFDICRGGVVKIVAVYRNVIDRLNGGSRVNADKAVRRSISRRIAGEYGRRTVVKTYIRLECDVVRVSCLAIGFHSRGEIVERDHIRDRFRARVVLDIQPVAIPTVRIDVPVVIGDNPVNFYIQRSLCQEHPILSIMDNKIDVFCPGAENIDTLTALACWHRRASQMSVSGSNPTPRNLYRLCQNH